MIDSQILTYKSKSYILHRELKSLEADYQKLIDISTKLELELESIINSIESKLNAQRKDIVGIILENNKMKMKIDAFKLGNRSEYSEIEDPQASSTPLKTNQLTDDTILHQDKLNKLWKGIKELQIDFDIVQEAYQKGHSVLEIKFPQKIQASLNNSLELLLTSVPGKDRDQMIKLVHLLNVSQTVF